MNAADMVNHPPHYSGHPSGLECIDVTRGMSFDLGNAVKYVYRAWSKGALRQDIEKARWYLIDYMRHADAQGQRTSLAADRLRILAAGEPVGSNPRKFFYALAEGKLGVALDALDEMLSDIPGGAR